MLCSNQSFFFKSTPDVYFFSVCPYLKQMGARGKNRASGKSPAKETEEKKEVVKQSSFKKVMDSIKSVPRYYILHILIPLALLVAWSVFSNRRSEESKSVGHEQPKKSSSSEFDQPRRSPPTKQGDQRSSSSSKQEQRKEPPSSSSKQEEKKESTSSVKHEERKESPSSSSKQEDKKESTSSVKHEQQNESSKSAPTASPEPVKGDKTESTKSTASESTSDEYTPLRNHISKMPSVHGVMDKLTEEIYKNPDNYVVNKYGEIFKRV